MKNMKFKKVSGILVPAPKNLRKKNIDFLLIGEDDTEYQLKGNRKTFNMWNLVDTRVQVKGFVDNHKSAYPKLNTVTFKCIDDFVDTDSLPINHEDDYDIDIANFDYAI